MTSLFHERKGRAFCIALILVGVMHSAASAENASSGPSSETATPASDPAAPDEPRLKFLYRPGIAFRLNPIGMFLGSDLLVSYRLYNSPSELLKSNFLNVGMLVTATPAFAKAGLGVEFAPLSVLVLSASYEFIGYFSSFGNVQSFTTPTAETGDKELDALAQAKTNYPTYGGILTLGALLQGKVGPIALRSQFKAFDYITKLRPGDRAWYDPTLDIMSPGTGWTINDDTDLLYVTNFGFIGGVRYTVTQSFFSAADYLPGEAQVNPNGPIHRIGPFLAYTFFDRPSARHFNSPTLVLIAQWHLKHRYRAGQEVSQAFPQLVLAFFFRGII